MTWITVFRARVKRSLASAPWSGSRAAIGPRSALG